jgi:hypothetical protein
MRNFVKKLLQILDGTPAVYGKRQRGQSVVEMAFITPLLIILVAGSIEVGWFANNYLILMEVTRVGARRATVLEGDNTPGVWERDTVKMDATIVASATAFVVRNCDSAVQSDFGFYKLITCVMLRSLDPLEIDDSNDVDDIVVSVFSIQTFEASEIPSGLPITPYYATVVGRYPSNANECSPSGQRDPFDFYNLGSVSIGEFAQFYDTSLETQVGFVWLGQHEIEGSASCIGSEFTSQDIEDLFNLNTFGTMNNERRGLLPNQGVVLVEMFWEHTLLLQFPAFSPVFNVLGDRTTIRVWAAFPVPSVEPRIRFD